MARGQGDGKEASKAQLGGVMAIFEQFRSETSSKRVRRKSERGMKIGQRSASSPGNSPCKRTGPRRVAETDPKLLSYREIGSLVADEFTTSDSVALYLADITGALEKAQRIGEGGARACAGQPLSAREKKDAKQVRFAAPDFQVLVTPSISEDESEQTMVFPLH